MFYFMNSIYLNLSENIYTLIYVYVCVCVSRSVRPALCDLMEFSRQECWSGLSFPFPEDLPTGIKPGFLALQADSLPSEPPGKPMCTIWFIYVPFRGPIVSLGGGIGMQGKSYLSLDVCQVLTRSLYWRFNCFYKFTFHLLCSLCKKERKKERKKRNTRI